jgi:uncharacterized Ntn-hydrolase superfamily protein
MQSASAGLTYATKGNILFPGEASEATIVQNAAATRLNETLRTAAGTGGAAPSVDAGDLIVIGNLEAGAVGAQNRRLDQ